MILIGMLDSPFVRRVAIALDWFDIGFEHRAWSVGRDAARIREYNVLGRVPTLVPDDGPVLTESAMILEHLEDRVGRAQSRWPIELPARHRARALAGLAISTLDRGMVPIYQQLFGSSAYPDDALASRCHGQVSAGFAEINAMLAAEPSAFACGGQPGHADTAIVCAATYLRDATGLDASDWPALSALVARCEALPEFAQRYAAFSPPKPGAPA